MRFKVSDMLVKDTPRIFIAKILPLEEFSSTSSSFASSKKLFEPKPRLRKFSKKPALPFPSIESNECWKINREHEEFCIDSPLRILCGQSSMQVTFVSLESDEDKKNVSNSITVRTSNSVPLTFCSPLSITWQSKRASWRRSAPTRFGNIFYT